MSSLVISMLAAIKAARSEADFYGISISLQKYATPKDIETLFQSKASFKPTFAKLISDAFDLVVLHNKDCHQFDHQPVSNNVSLYIGAPNNKRILIGFCGKAQLLTLPIPVILQYFAPNSYDVAVVRDPGRLGFTTGSTGYADTFPAMIAQLQRDLDLSRYETIVCMGTSGGGAGALAGAILLKAASVASFCGRPPTSSSIYGRTKPAADLEAIIRASDLPKNRAFAIYGAENARDKDHARQLARLANLTLLPLSGISDHNVMASLHGQGQLAHIFEKVGLLGREEAQHPMAASPPGGLRDTSYRSNRR